MLHTYHIYDLDGPERAVIARDSKPNNVDLLYGFNLGPRKVGHARGIQMWTIAPLTREFSNATVGETIPALGKGEDEPYGCCAYKNSRPATQNFKLFGWEDIAGANLLIDTGWSPRESATAR